MLLPIQKDKIRREYHFLKHLDHPNIAKLKDIVKCDNLRTTSLVFELCPQQDFRELYPTLNLKDIKLYMGQLFNALDYIHSQGIMHRDIKPYNVLIDSSSKTLKVIDFGLSEYYIPGKDNSDHVGSLYYKAPELLFGNQNYDYRVDCWAAGLILAGMIFKKTPFIFGNDSVDQVLKVTKLMGTK